MMRKLILALAVFALAVSGAHAQTNPAPLLAAAKQGSVKAIRQALGSGIDVNAADKDGWTALALAASGGKPDAVKTLLKAGAAVNVKASGGQTPLMAAVLSGNRDVVKLLLDGGADAFAATVEGASALDIARRSGKKPLSDLLAEHMVKINKMVAAKSEQAAGAFKAGNYAKAAGLFREAVLLNPEDDFDWHFLGRALEKSDDLKGAQEAYQRSLDVAPNGSVAQRNQTYLAKLQTRLENSLRDCPDCPEMVKVPSGSFDMGGDRGGYDDELPIHSVTFARPFALGRTEVTQAQWKAVMGNNPSANSGCENCPVEQVSVLDVQEFLDKLNAKTGKQYRLPTEAEWEYACRAGARQMFCGSDDPNSVAWFGETTAQPVAGKQPNAWGLYDMSGNVWEWVQDPPHDNYYGAPADGGVWNGDATYRVARGGSWYGAPQYGRAGVRGKHPPTARFNDGGFRLARDLP
jgi:formylglycine-generating enzyme required for sulfatase activity